MHFAFPVTKGDLVSNTNTSGAAGKGELAFSLMLIVGTHMLGQRTHCREAVSYVTLRLNGHMSSRIYLSFDICRGRSMGIQAYSFL
jgi:hypothetical protein